MSTQALRAAFAVLVLVSIEALTLTTPVSPKAGTSELAPAPATPVQLLTTEPDDLRKSYGWPQAHQVSKTDKALNVWKALRKGYDVRTDMDMPEHIVPPVLRRQLDACLPVASGTLQTEHRSADGTIKLLLALADGLAVECVLIPMSDKHTSLCVSSQVGCSRGCAFCSTGTMGLVRNLSPEEILTQVWMAQRLVRERRLPPLVNIVFMGMGEPLNNLKSVTRAVEMLVHPQAFNLSPRNVVVSTVGPSPAVIAAAARALPCRMAWSVHAAGDELRKLLVPTTAHSMVELRDGFIDGFAEKSERLSALVVELALIRGVNDGAEHAEQLAALLHVFGRGGVLVNLIPYNDNGLGLDALGGLFEAPSKEAVHAFQRRMWDHGLLCTVRATRGDDERSACGQLATEAQSARGASRE